MFLDLGEGEEGRRRKKKEDNILLIICEGKNIPGTKEGRVRICMLVKIKKKVNEMINLLTNKINAYKS